MTWTEKYRPSCFVDIKGQEIAVERIEKFIKDFRTNPERIKKKAVILYGPPGVGKTTLAHVSAIETNSEIFELNASDLRNKNKLQEIMRPAIEQQSLIKEDKIILVDEVDGISGVDRGGISELVSLIDITTYPIVITANDVWDKKLSPIRKISELLQLKEINYKTIIEVLSLILEKEEIKVEEDVIKRIAINAKGDLRAAINDLQMIANVKDPSQIFADERNKEVDIFNVLRRIFKGKATNELLGIFDSVNMSMDELILWVEENIPAEYKGEELARAYENLSRVDLFKGRIYKQQYWRFLVYENIFLSYGISASKDQNRLPGTGFTSYKKPTRVLKIWMNNQRTAKKKSIAKKYAQYVHVGEKRAMNEFPLIKEILKNQTIRKELKLTEEEVEYLEK